MEFRVLGPLDVRSDDGPVSVGGARLRALLARLLLEPNRVVTTDRLIEDLWEGRPPRSAPTALRVHLTRLRAALEPGRPRTEPSTRIVAEASGYRLRVEPGELDAERFARLVELADGAELGLATRLALLDAALAIWRGGAYGDVRDLTPIVAEAERLEELRARALEQRFEHRLAAGEHASLVAELEHACQQHPLRERLVALHMTALARAGRQTDALRAYARLRATLREELGIEPDPELRRLETAILDQDESAGLVMAAEPDERPCGRLAVVVAVGDTDGAGTRVPAERVAHHGGRVVADGDDLVCDFATVDGALAFVDDARASTATAGTAFLRFGVAVGDVVGDVVGDAGAGRAGPGDALLVEARRLCASAAPGEARASELTAALAGARTTTPVGDAARGAVAGDVVVAGLAPDGGRRSSEHLPFPELLETATAGAFAGRSAELARVLDPGEGRAGLHVVLVGGEPGIGKTRLVAEAARAAYRGGATVLYGRCDEEVRAPFQPFLEALDQYVAHAGPAAIAERVGPRVAPLVRLVPELAEVVPGLPEPVDSDPETGRYRLFEAVADWLRALAAARPVLLVLDDLHWAARPTLLMLRHLARSPRLHGVSIVCTFRDTRPDSTDELREVVAELGRLPGVEPIHLQGLDVDGIAALLAPLGPHADEVAALLESQTAGNPLFLGELVRHLDASGALDEPDVRAVSAALLAMRVPEGVRDVIALRVARLGDDVVEVLRNASVIGVEFDLPILCAVASRDEQAILRALDEAEAARLAEETAVDRYRFSHALVQSALYEPLPPGRRARLHRRCTEALETMAATHELDADRRIALARHAIESAPVAGVEHAVWYAIDAADLLIEGLAFEVAVQLCRSALAVLDTAPRSTSADVGAVCDLRIRLGRAEMRAADPAARRTLLDAYELARAIRDPARMADALLSLSRGFFARVARTDVEVVEALEGAIAAQPSEDSTVLAELLAVLASELVWAVDGERRFALADAALAMARRLDDRRALANVLLLRNLTISAPDTVAERTEQCFELLRIADELDDPAVRFHAAFHRSGTAVESGDVEAGSAMVELANQLAADLRQPTLLWQASFMRTARMILEGALEDAEAAALRTLEIGRAAGRQGEAFVFFMEQMLEIRRWQDRLDEMLNDFVDLAGVPEFDLGCTLTRHAFDAGAHDAARRAYDHTMRAITLPPRRDMLATTLLGNLAYLATRFDDRERAPAIADALQPVAHLVASTTVARAVGDHHRGMLAALMGRAVDADARFAAACAVHERMRAPLLLAETRVEWAEAVAAREPARARDLLDDAASTATRHGAGFLQRRIDEIAPTVR